MLPHSPYAYSSAPSYHIHNTLQYVASLSCSLWADIWLPAKMLLIYAFEHLKKTLWHRFGLQCSFHALLCAGVHASNLISVITMLVSVIFPKAIHTKRNNAWRLLQNVSHFLLVLSLQVNTFCTTGFLAFCCWWWSKNLCNIVIYVPLLPALSLIDTLIFWGCYLNLTLKDMRWDYEVSFC